MYDRICVYLDSKSYFNMKFARHNRSQKWRIWINSTSVARYCTDDEADEHGLLKYLLWKDF